LEDCLPRFVFLRPDLTGPAGFPWPVFSTPILDGYVAPPLGGPPPGAPGWSQSSSARKFPRGRILFTRGHGSLNSPLETGKGPLGLPSIGFGLPRSFGYDTSAVVPFQGRLQSRLVSFACERLRKNEHQPSGRQTPWRIPGFKGGRASLPPPWLCPFFFEPGVDKFAGDFLPVLSGKGCIKLLGTLFQHFLQPEPSPPTSFPGSICLIVFFPICPVLPWRPTLFAKRNP